MPRPRPLKSLRRRQRRPRKRESLHWARGNATQTTLLDHPPSEMHRARVLPAWAGYARDSLPGCYCHRIVFGGLRGVMKVGAFVLYRAVSSRQPGTRRCSPATPMAAHAMRERGRRCRETLNTVVRIRLSGRGAGLRSGKQRARSPFSCVSHGGREYLRADTAPAGTRRYATMW